jgi:hypothetical protein
MYPFLKRLFEEGRLNLTGLSNAVAKGWITAEEYTEISGEVYAG